MCGVFGEMDVSVVIRVSSVELCEKRVLRFEALSFGWDGPFVRWQAGTSTPA